MSLGHQIVGTNDQDTNWILGTYYTPPLSRPLILDAKTRKYDWPILCTVPFCSGHFLFSSQCLDFDVTLKDRFPGARLLWRRKIADCDKLDGGVISGGFCACVMYLCLDLLEVSYLYVRGGVISGGRLPCYVFSSWMYTEVSSVLVTHPVITLYSLLYWIEILCNKVDIESTGVGNPLHALLILSRENPATHSFPNCTVSSALLVFFIFAGLPIICFNTGHWCSLCERVQEYIDLHFGSLGANWLLRWNKAFTSELCTCTRGWFGVTLRRFWECGKRGLAIVFTG